MSQTTESPQKTGGKNPVQIKVPASAFYAVLLSVVVLASVALGWHTPLLLPSVKSKILVGAAKLGGSCVSFVLLHLLLEVAINNKQSMKALWPLQQVSRFRNWLWSGVVLSIGFGVLGNYLYEQAKANDATTDQTAPATLTPPRTTPTPESAALSQPVQEYTKRATVTAPAPNVSTSKEGQTTADQAATLPASVTKPESYATVTLFVPTRFRDLQVFVDGEPARVIDRQLSQIKLQVPRRSGPTQFKLQSNLLSKPREFSLQIERDHFEYSPFQ